MMNTQAHRRVTGIEKMEPKNRIHRQVVGNGKNGQMSDHGCKGVGMTKQRKRKTNGQSGAGSTELKDQAHHRNIGPRKAGITILGERTHPRIITKTEIKDGEPPHLKEHGTTKDIKEDIEVKTLVYEEMGKKARADYEGV